MNYQNSGLAQYHRRNQPVEEQNNLLSRDKHKFYTFVNPLLSSISKMSG